MSHEFAYLSQFLKQRSGLDLAADKQYLLESRLRPIARKYGHDGLSELVTALKLPGSAALQDEVVEAMTTNESFFFRDKTPFDQFRETILPELTSARSATRRMRIWCAAASTGQEPYSLAMEIREFGSRLANWSVDIIGTDLSPQVLQKAKTGIYSQFEVQRGLPIQMLVKYFEQKGEMWQISPQIRAMVQYREHNLLEDFSRLGKFDVVFCRNVLIYFDPPTKADVLRRIRQQLSPDGYLVLGASETVIGLTQDFALVPGSRGLYRPRAEADAEQPKRAVAGGSGSMAATAHPGLTRSGPGSANRPPSGTQPATPVRPAGLVQAGRPLGSLSQPTTGLSQPGAAPANKERPALGGTRPATPAATRTPSRMASQTTPRPPLGTQPRLAVSNPASSRPSTLRPATAPDRPASPRPPEKPER